MQDGHNRINSNLNNNSISFSVFTKHVPNLGGFIEINPIDFEHNLALFEQNEINDRLPIKNTCSIDYFLLSLWCSVKFSESLYSLIEFYEKSIDFFISLKKIINLIDEEFWDRAKTIWILLICKLKRSEDLSFDLYSSEYGSFIKYMRLYQEIQYFCNKCCKNVILNKKDLNMTKENGVVFIDASLPELCEYCNQWIDLSFLNKPISLFIESKPNITINEDLTLNDIPLAIKIDKLNF